LGRIVETTKAPLPGDAEASSTYAGNSNKYQQAEAREQQDVQRV
jgi:hypothetical protein